MKLRSPLPPVFKRKKLAADSSLAIQTGSVCTKNAVLLTFLICWQLLPAKSLFLKGTLRRAKPCYVIRWHRLQDWYCEETAEALQSRAVLQTASYCAPAPPTAPTVRDGTGEEMQPRCEGRRLSQRQENQLVHREEFCLTMVGSRS